MKLSKSLETLEGKVWEKPSIPSHLATECYRLRKLPLNKLSAENLRMLIGQNIGLEFLIPIALEKLEENILTSGNMYDGDLLFAVAQIDGDFWSKNPDLNNRLVEIRSEAEAVAETLSETIAALENREFI